MKSTRRSFLALLGLAPAAPLLAKIPTIQTAPSRVHWLLEGPAGTGKTRAAQNLRGIDPTARTVPWRPMRQTYVWGDEEVTMPLRDLSAEKYRREAAMHRRLDALDDHRFDIAGYLNAAPYPGRRT